MLWRMMMELPFGRTEIQAVLLKLSGEALMGDRASASIRRSFSRIAGEIKDVHASASRSAIVIGGGNIFRGLAASAEGF